MRVIVCGGRDFTDRDLAVQALDWIDINLFHIDFVVEGGQRTHDDSGLLIGGADWFAEEWALTRGVDYESMLAGWRRWKRCCRQLLERRNAAALGSCGGDRLQERPRHAT